jgi:hypothetical protein
VEYLHKNVPVDMDAVLSAPGMAPSRASETRGTSLYLKTRLLEPIAPGFQATVLEVCCEYASRKEAGDSRESVNAACKHTRNILTGNDFVNPDRVLYPSSLDMIRTVLGAENPSQYRFGWCAYCGERFEESAEEKAQRRLAATCAICGELKYKVRICNAVVHLV